MCPHSQKTQYSASRTAEYAILDLMIKTIIVDDESNAIQSLKWEMEHFCPEMEVVATFTDPTLAIEAINELWPDCVFLDIQMPQMDGFAMLERLSYRQFALVITTAFESYALKAFKENAIDYLMKPVDSDDLKKSVEKIKRIKSGGTPELDVRRMIEVMAGQQERKRIPLHLNGKIIYQDIEEITYCEADGNYTTVYTKSGQKTVVSKKIKEIEAMLPASSFYRVHQSYVVNTGCIKEYVRSDGQYLLIADGITVPVSRAKRAEVLELLEGI